MRIPVIGMIIVVVASLMAWGIPAQAQGLTSTYEFINLSAIPVDFYRDEAAVFFNNGTATLSAERVITDPASTTFRIYPANADPASTPALAELTVDLTGGEIFLVAAVETNGVYQLVQHTFDLNVIGPNLARVEVVHLSAGLPNLALVGQNGDVLVEQAVMGQSTYADVPGGTYQMGFKDAADLAGADVYTRTVNLKAGELDTLIFYGADQANLFEIIQPLEQLGAIRIVHAGQVLPNVDVYFGENAVFLELAYLSDSGYHLIAPGEYQVKVVEAGGSVNAPAIWEGPITIANNAPLTGVLFGENGARLSLYQDDHLQMPPNQARVRFINAAFNLPLLTVMNGASVMTDALGYALGSRNLAVEAGSYTYDFEETQGAPYATAEAVIQPNHNYTFIAAGNPVVNDSLDVIVLDWYWNTEE